MKVIYSCSGILLEHLFIDENENVDFAIILYIVIFVSTFILRDDLHKDDFYFGSLLILPSAWKGLK